MQISPDIYEKLGSFYLGRPCDAKTRVLEDDLLLYDSKDLVTHGVVLGMTGSGKTGLCMAMLEEAAMDNIPAIIIDPKGDIANLTLSFPNLSPADFAPWVNEDDARRENRTPSQHAEKTAELWKNGLAEWGQGTQRITALREKVEVNIFTPGSNAGIPVSILGSLEVPPFEILDDAELFGDRVESTVSSLLSLIEVEADQTPEGVLLSNIFQSAWKAGQSLTLESLIFSIQKPSFTKIGVLDLESFFPSKDRQKLSLKFNALLASPRFSAWLEGVSLDPKGFLSTPEGKPRMSIFSIAHLNDTERMFFVSLLLNQVLGWMRTQSGTTSLRAILYMDELFGYLPPTANPPSKKPMLTLLKQARAFGLGLLLATQNPVDLDYKALSNIGTWFLGRLQTQRDKDRVLEGLMSSSGGLSREELENTLAYLDKQVFLMHNVNEKHPVTFKVRWVMSYLCGPLARAQIKSLMDPLRARFKSQAVRESSSNPMSRATSSIAVRPIVGNGVIELFAPSESEGATYQPHLLREASVCFSHEKSNAQSVRKIRHLNPMSEKGIEWEREVACPAPLESFQSEPNKGVSFGELPGFAMNAENYKTLDNELEEDIYRKETAHVFYSGLFEVYSNIDEKEGDFRARLLHLGRETRDATIEELRKKYAAKIASKIDQRQKAEITIDKEKAEASSATWSAVGGFLIGFFGGRKMGGISAASGALKQRGDVGRAEKAVELIQDDIAALGAELKIEVDALSAKFDPSQTTLENMVIKPFKKDVSIEKIALLWVPV